MPRAEPSDPSSSPACEACPLVERRAFLGQAALALAGVVAALGGAPGKAAALPLRFGRALAAAGDLLTYPVPAADGAQIDHDNQVILVRYQQKVYAFNLSCPHQNTALHWQPEDGIFQCPKHHSRYQPDGTFIHMSRQPVAVQHGIGIGFIRAGKGPVTDPRITIGQGRICLKPHLRLAGFLKRPGRTHPVRLSPDPIGNFRL